jgi:hypothetical protein
MLQLLPISVQFNSAHFVKKRHAHRNNATRPNAACWRCFSMSGQCNPPVLSKTAHRPCDRLFKIAHLQIRPLATKQIRRRRVEQRQGGLTGVGTSRGIPPQPFIVPAPIVMEGKIHKMVARAVIAGKRLHATELGASSQPCTSDKRGAQLRLMEWRTTGGS